MIRSALAAAALLASTSAFAGDVYNFKIGGQSVHIEQPRNCNEASCMVVSIPGIYEQNTRRKKARDAADDQTSVSRDKKEADTRLAPTDNAPAAPASAPQPSVAANTPAAKSLEPANGTAQPSSPSTAAPEASRAEPSSGGLAPPKVATLAPAPSPAPAVAPAANSPLGVWLTEEKEGKVRIEECGTNLCGFSVDAKSGANGEKVLINMKPAKDKWSGKIHDPKSGSSYDSTIAMRSDNRLRVQGCAFGGMFCGGQTWTRAN